MRIKATTSTQAPWVLYLLECRGGALYAGITNDLEARYAAHVAGRGAKYTRANPPRRIVGQRAYPDRATASRAEWAVKQMRRAEKLEFVKMTEAENGNACK